MGNFSGRSSDKVYRRAGCGNRSHARSERARLVRGTPENDTVRGGKKDKHVISKINRERIANSICENHAYPCLFGCVLHVRTNLSLRTQAAKTKSRPVHVRRQPLRIRTPVRACQITSVGMHTF